MMSERVTRGVYFEGDDRISSYSSWFIGPWNGEMVEPMLIQPMFTPFSTAGKS